MSLSILNHASVSAAITRVGVSFLPVYLHDNALPEMHTGSESGPQIDELESTEVSLPNHRLGAGYRQIACWQSSRSWGRALRRQRSDWARQGTPRGNWRLAGTGTHV